MRGVTTLAGFLCVLSAAPVAAQDQPSSPFCVVPVRDGTPTEKDVNQAWRMVSGVVMLPGVPRPVIYAYNRRGVWTIDETRAFVPFGGEFPSNPIHDHFARDPDTGRIVGVDNARGVFALDPGEIQFRKLHGISATSLRHPYSVEFIPRFAGFVIGDPNGLFLLDRTGALSLLPIADRNVLRIPFGALDLPAFNALVINAQDSQAVLRFDDGDVARVGSFAQGDYVVGVTAETDGRVSLRTNKTTRTIRLFRPPVTPIVQGQSFVIKRTGLRISHGWLEAASIGRTIVLSGGSRLDDVRPDGTIPLALPFDPAQEPIYSLVEIPQYRAVVILTRGSGYTLQAEGPITEIPDARTADGSRLGAPVGIIPVRNESIFLGRNALNLLLDSRMSGEAACRAAP